MTIASVNAYQNQNTLYFILLCLLGLIDSRGTETSAREILLQGSAAVRLRFERRRVSGSPDWTARLDVVPRAGAGPEEVVVAFGAGVELVLDFCRSRKVTLGWGWSLSLRTEEQKTRVTWLTHPVNTSWCCALNYTSGLWRVSYHLTCWLSGGRDCCNNVFPNNSSSSMGLGGAVGLPTGGACGVWTTAGNNTSDCVPSEVWEDKRTV